MKRAVRRRVLLWVGVVLIAAACSDDGTTTTEDLLPTNEQLEQLDELLGIADFQSRGDDPNRDILWDECGGGVYISCDVLYYISAFGSEYERFGATCGDRTRADGRCAEELGAPPSLDGLRQDCADGGFIECDLLYSISEVDSEFERFGDTCGDRGRTATYCVDEYGARHP